jgi:hypothetical protein
MIPSCRRRRGDKVALTCGSSTKLNIRLRAGPSKVESDDQDDDEGSDNDDHVSDDQVSDDDEGSDDDDESADDQEIDERVRRSPAAQRMMGHLINPLQGG